ncbi:MAG: HAMP domain-containing sensor histidine kinase [Candidatus Omnitrophica bacterium]|nr:HAMP domain-containing sensor histidine kinase [Candidatus Omnitrophota bacterium]
MEKQDKTNKISYKLVLQELKEDPYKKLNIAFSLMVVVPFLVFFYLLTSRLFTMDVLIGNTGFIVMLSLFISLCGFYIVYSILKNIFNKILAYAAQAKHSDQLKSTFVATVSHELKNPLASIKINIYNISTGVIGQVNEEQKDALGLCQLTVERMVRLVNGLLDLHKIEAGVIDVKRHKLNLTEILEKQIKELQILADRKNIKIIKEFSDRNLSVWGDEDKLSQAIINLLSNGIKFTPENGMVTLKIYPDDKFVKLECIDTGPGIPDADMEKLFNKFERLNAANEGTGLGLAITKDIVEMHRGKILVESQVGKGSRFILLLPSDLRLTKR